MSSNISSDIDIVFQEYPTVLNKKIIEQFFLNNMKTKQENHQQQKENFFVNNNPSFNKTGLGININITSIIMAILLPLLYLILIIYKKTITLQFFNINISAIIFFIFNLIIFIISLKTINKINNGYNCKINENLLNNNGMEPSLKISNLELTSTADKEIINKLNLNTESIICSNTLNYDNFNNIKSTSGYYGFLVLTIILQIVQLIFLLYYSFYSDQSKDNKKYFMIFYMLLSLNVCALFICLVINIIGNKIAFVSDVPITSFKTLIDKNSKLHNNNKLIPSELASLYEKLDNNSINYNYLICNSNSTLTEFKYKDLNNSFSGFLLVVLIITLIMFFFLTMVIFSLDLSNSLRILQWFILSFSVGLVSGFTSFITALDMQQKYAEIIGVCIGFAVAAIPILLKIILSIINKVAN